MSGEPSSSIISKLHLLCFLGNNSHTKILRLIIGLATPVHCIYKLSFSDHYFHSFAKNDYFVQLTVVPQLVD